MSKDIDKPIVLIGLMGAGKTTVGKALSKKLCLDFFDVDDVIERKQGKKISEIFSDYGESHFRNLERQTIEALVVDAKKSIISLGGGAFMDKSTRNLIKRKAISIYLDASNEELKRRVGRGEGRPLLNGVDVGNKIRILKDVRNPVYQKADFTVITKEESVDETVNRVIKAIQS